ncbi:MAG: hypothetical protein AB7K64_22580 [Variibacter sp.]
MTGEAASPFFVREDGGIGSLPAEIYIAGYRLSACAEPAVKMTLPAEVVDMAVLTGARLSVWLSACDGRLILDGEGVDSKALEAALDAGPMRAQTLLSLIDACLDPHHLATDEDPIDDLTSLRTQLVEAVARVDAALARMKAG